MLSFIRSLPNTATIAHHPEAGQVHWGVNDCALQIGLESSTDRRPKDPLLTATAVVSAMLKADVTAVTSLQIIRRVEDLDTASLVMEQKDPAYTEMSDDGWVREVWTMMPDETEAIRTRWQTLLERFQALGDDLRKVMEEASERLSVGFYRLFRAAVLRHCAAAGTRDLDWYSEAGQTLLKDLERDAKAAFMLAADVRLWINLDQTSISILDVLEQRRADRPAIIVRRADTISPDLGERIGIIFRLDDGTSKVVLAHVIAESVHTVGNGGLSRMQALAAYTHAQINDPYFKA